MTTARDIIRGAYQRLGLIALGADLDPDRAADGLIVYNGMLDAWQCDGIFPGGPAGPIRFTDGLYVSGDFVNGEISSLPGSYPPYGPSDASSPPDNPSIGPFTLNSAWPFPEQFKHGATALLACELANAAGIEASKTTQYVARKGYQALLAYFVIAPNANVDPALTWLPSLRRYGFR
jgi:hypothetical protein